MSQQHRQDSHLSFLEEAQVRAQQQLRTPPQRGHPLQATTLSNARQERSNKPLQQSKDSRRPQSSSQDIAVRIITAATRFDVSGAAYTAFIISVSFPGFVDTILVEHRYSDFCKLQSLLQHHSIRLDSSFPTKHWAGRLGQWTPSLTLAPQQHEELVQFRKIQLDVWLVDLVAYYNHKKLPRDIHVELEDFLSTDIKPPCDRDIKSESTTMQTSLKLMNPLSYTLGSAIRQATHVLQLMCKNEGWNESDQSIPLDLLHVAKGLCFLTVVKAGLVVSGKVGTGLLLEKKPDGTWSAPCALGTLGFGWGAQVGGDLTHYLVVFTTSQAVEALGNSSSFTLGAEMGVAVGPVGRGAQLLSSAKLQPAYAYAHSSGLFVGISLEGSVVTTRSDINAKFYGRKVQVLEVLHHLPQPKAAERLYEALEAALDRKIPSKGIRPSHYWNGCNNNSGESPVVWKVPSANNHILIDGVPAIFRGLSRVESDGSSPLMNARSRNNSDQSSLLDDDDSPTRLPNEH